MNVLGGAAVRLSLHRKYEGGGHARYEVVEAQAEVVRQIFAWIALDRCSIGQVCRQLQDREILSPTRQELLGPNNSVGDAQEFRLRGTSSVWQDARRAAVPSIYGVNAASRRSQGKTLRFTTLRPRIRS